MKVIYQKELLRSYPIVAERLCDCLICEDSFTSPITEDTVFLIAYPSERTKKIINESKINKLYIPFGIDYQGIVLNDEEIDDVITKEFRNLYFNHLEKKYLLKGSAEKEKHSKILGQKIKTGKKSKNSKIISVWGDPKLAIKKFKKSKEKNIILLDLDFLFAPIREKFNVRKNSVFEYFREIQLGNSTKKSLEVSVIRMSKGRYILSGNLNPNDYESLNEEFLVTLIKLSSQEFDKVILYLPGMPYDLSTITAMHLSEEIYVSVKNDYFDVEKKYSLIRTMNEYQNVPEKIFRIIAPLFSRDLVEKVFLGFRIER